MFYTYDDILAALKNGTDPGEIAQAFTNDLHKAIQESEGPTAYQEAVAKLAAIEMVRTALAKLI